jgi:hypothetical protein
MKEQTVNIGERVLETFKNMGASIVDALPMVILGIVLVIVALVVAKIVEKLLRASLSKIRLDTLLGRVGVDKTLQRIGFKQSLTILLPRMTYFLLLLLFAKTAADVLGLHAISGAMGAFFAYLPNIIAALLLVILGSLAGQFAGGMVTQAAEESGIEFASPLGNVVSGVILFVVGIMAIGQLKVETEIIQIFTVCALAGMALAFGLSFGLGSRDMTRNIIAGFYARKVFRVGEMIEIHGQKGILKAITPTQALLDADGTTISVSNAVFMDEVVRQ